MSNISESEHGVTGVVLLDLNPNHDNWIRFRVFDLVGNGPAETVAIHLPVDIPPIARISSPRVDDRYYDDVKIKFDSTGSSDEEGTLSVVWTIDGDRLERTDPVFKAILPAGNHTVRLVVIDEAGQSNETEMMIQVHTADVESGAIGMWVLVAILIAIVIAVLLIRQGSRP